MNSDEVRRAWEERSGAYSPTYYAHYGADDTSEAIRHLFEAHLPPDAAVLELGCSAGRHLAHLHDHGFDDLTGIELNGDAFDVMADTYPDLADTGVFYHAAIEDVVGDFPDDAFDAVFSVETLQHLPPDAEWVFAELARITGDLLVTVENEGGPDADAGPDADVNYVDGEFPLYYRDWNDIFTAQGLTEFETISRGRDTLRAFRPYPE